MEDKKDITIEQYDSNGFDTNGIHRDTGKKYDTEGYNKERYDRRGFDRKGKHKDTHTYTNKSEFDARGFKRGNLISKSYGINKITGTKFDVNGFDVYGFDSEGYDKNGFDRDGFDKEGYEEETIDITKTPEELDVNDKIRMYKND